MYLSPISFISEDIPMSGIGTYDVGTTEGDCDFIPTQIIFICTDSNSVLGAVTASVGTNSSSYNNINPATALVGLLSGKQIPITINQITDIFGPSSHIKCKVSIGLTLGTGTIKAVVSGYNVFS